MSNESISDFLALIDWQGASIYTTARGKLKPIVTGIPSATFWHRWHKQAESFRPVVRAAGVTVKRIAKGQWEAILWPRKENFALVAALGFALPTVQQPENPF